MEVSDDDDDLADGEAVPAFNFMDSDEEDEFDRTALSRSIEDAPPQVSVPATTDPASSTATQSGLRCLR